MYALQLNKCESELNLKWRHLNKIEIKTKHSSEKLTKLDQNRSKKTIKTGLTGGERHFIYFS